MRHLRHHIRFYGAILIGVVVWALTGMLAAPIRAVVAGDALFVAYLLAVLGPIWHGTADWLQRRADYEDEGLPVIALVTVAAIGISLLSVFTMLNQADGPDRPHVALAVASVPLGWGMLQTVFAFHYAHLYYTNVVRDGVKGDARGLDFPATDLPRVWDFVYFSTVIGMTAQVSDVSATTTQMRRLITWHAVVSFFFNAVILALAVNVAAGVRL